MSDARRLWRLLEPYHGITYFSPESRQEFRATGLMGLMQAYLGGRTAALGRSPVAAAALYNFNPRLVTHILAQAWERTTPAEVLAARLAGVDRTLRRIGIREVGDAPSLLREATELLEPHGRPMFAANAAQPWPDEPHLALWHGATLIREHRGDGHATALLHEEVDGCEAHVIVIASGVVGREWVRFRGWTDEDCAAASERLRSRGWLDDSGLTTAGREAHARVEAHTDRLAASVWQRFGEYRTERLAKSLRDLVDTVRASDVLPDPYPPIG